jgi:thiol-disulfide isomerase/thioredoxin
MTMMLRKSNLFLLSVLFFNLSYSQKTIPNISLPNLENKIVPVNSLIDNDLIILSFWATWCLPCVKELNAINDIYEDWQEETGVELIAVSIDDNRTISRVRPMVKSYAWKYKILFDKNQDLKRALQINDIPYTIIFNNGEIVFEHTGYKQGDEEFLFSKIKAISSKNKQ